MVSYRSTFVDFTMTCCRLTTCPPSLSMACDWSNGTPLSIYHMLVSSRAPVVLVKVGGWDSSSLLAVRWKFIRISDVRLITNVRTELLLTQMAWLHTRRKPTENLRNAMESSTAGVALREWHCGSGTAGVALREWHWEGGGQTLITQ